jgi:Uma2 family endonuclease
LDTNRLVEFSDGFIEVLPMPTDKHQAIVAYLFVLFRDFLKKQGGTVRFAPLRLQIRSGKYREPDLLLLLSADDSRRRNAFWEGADLVVEVVSPDDRQRDLVTKRREYAGKGIREYWIVDPELELITVLALEGDTYETYGQFGRGEVVHSQLLAGLKIKVNDVIEAD